MTRAQLFSLSVDLQWVLDEIDAGTLKASPAQRAALAAAEKSASEIYNSKW
jgi:hypothetical protein